MQVMWPLPSRVRLELKFQQSYAILHDLGIVQLVNISDRALSAGKAGSVSWRGGGSCGRVTPRTVHTTQGLGVSSWRIYAYIARRTECDARYVRCPLKWSVGVLRQQFYQVGTILIWWWRGGGIRSPDRPVRKQSLYRLRYPTHVFFEWIRMLHVSEKANWKSSGRGIRKDRL
jgi:hypothetical protein